MPEMADEEYIRAGVELAEGWRFNTPEEREKHDTSYWRQELVRIPSFGHYALPLSQQALDALAAQLVRQVDALGCFEVSAYPENTSVVETDGEGGFVSLAGYNTGNDRAMNAIRAIVDSGALPAQGGRDG